MTVLLPQIYRKGSGTDQVFQGKLVPHVWRHGHPLLWRASNLEAGVRMWMDGGSGMELPFWWLPALHHGKA